MIHLYTIIPTYVIIDIFIDPTNNQIYQVEEIKYVVSGPIIIDDELPQLRTMYAKNKTNLPVQRLVEVGYQY